MKMIMITYDRILDHDVVAILREENVSSYIKQEGVTGVDQRNIGREQKVLPGSITTVHCALEDDMARRIVDRLLSVRKELRDAKALGVFVWRLEESE